jgi:quercetin dioxygenase-like cupin family protein
MSRHLVRRGGAPHFVAAGDGLRSWSMLDENTPAVHTGFVLDELAPGGEVPARVQSFEESFFVLDGAPVLRTPEGAVALVPGDYGLLPVGYPHAWRNEGDKPARWTRMLAPQPRQRFGGDARAVPLADTGPARPVDVRDPRNRLLGHLDPAEMDVDKQTQDLLARSASMRTALLVYSGITVKMMVDADLGAALTTMFMVRYEPHGVAGPHDHPFEETYFFLEGVAEAIFDGQTYRLRPGDVAFAGVGCVHGFRNLGDGPLRWLETQSPQPPGRHSYRFVRDWDYLGAPEGS